MSFALSVLIILIIFFLIILVAVSRLISGVMSIFGYDKKNNEQNETASKDNANRSQWNGYSSPKQNKTRKVLFEKDEGEYVDFEEIKEED